MCFLTKCPYVPPHAFDLDFPHLMLRYRAVEAKKGQDPSPTANSPRPTATAKPAKFVAPLANWATATATNSCAACWKWSPVCIARPNCRLCRRKTLVGAGAKEVPRLNHGGARLRQAQGRALRHLLDELQRPDLGWLARKCWRSSAWRPRLSIPAAAACRSLSKGFGEVVANARKVAPACGRYRSRVTTSSLWSRAAR